MIYCTCCGGMASKQCDDHDTGYGVCDSCLKKYGRSAFCHVNCKAHGRVEFDIKKAIGRIRAIIGVDDELGNAINSLERSYNLLNSAVVEWAGRFETEEDINGADCVDWLGEFIENACGAICENRVR